MSRNSAANTEERGRSGETVEAFGSIAEVPGLPAGFTDVFDSRYVEVNGLRLHAVVGGAGKPLLLLGGWPQFWYQWRLIMLDLASTYTIVAMDPKGTGRSDKPAKAYDSATLAAESHGLMKQLGFERYALVSHDVGSWTAYAMVVDEPGRIDRLVVSETLVPGLSPSPPLLGDDKMNGLLWHYPFNRLDGINEALVAGREHIYFPHQFKAKAASPDGMKEDAINVYVRALRNPGALHASFEFYRSLMENVRQNEERKKQKITIPVLAISSSALGLDVAGELSRYATDVTGHTIAGGHFIAEENPVEFLRVVRSFLDH